MVDKVSSFVIAFDGQEGSLAAVIAALKKTVKSAVSELEAATKRIDLFSTLEQDVKKAEVAFKVAADNVAKLKAQIDKLKSVGAPIDENMSKALKILERDAISAGKALQTQTSKLDALGATLRKAGIDTSNLAAEQQKLAVAMKAATAAAATQSAKDLLGFKGVADIQPQIQKLNAAFGLLRDSGKLSFGELSVAQARLHQQIGLLNKEVGGLGQSFVDIRGKLVAFAAAFAGVTAGVFASAKNFRDFAQQVAAVDSIADVSKEKIAGLAAGVRELAKTMGVDAVQSTRALYEIISSGIPAENALTVLEKASKAAIAGITDVDTAARAGVAIINGYGLEITQLDHVYDVLFQTVKDGVVTFPQLANEIGSVIPAARAAKIPLEEIGAAFVVLTRQGIAAPEAATAINRAIISLAAPAPAAADKLRELGITVDGLSGTIEQLASRNFNLSQITAIVPDDRGARAVLALVNNFGLLKDTLVEMNTQAGQMEAAYLKLANTPQQQVARFNSAVKDLSISLGEFVTGTGGLVTSLTKMVDAFNSLTPATKTLVLQFTAFTVAGAALIVIARQLLIPINLLAGALTTAGVAGHAAAGGITAASLAIKGLGGVVAAFVGLKIGDVLYENFAPIRKIGDTFGVLAAQVSNFAEGGLTLLMAKLTGNKNAADAASAAFMRNQSIIGGMWNDVVSGAAEKARALGVEQAKLRDDLIKLSAAASDAAGTLDTAVSKIAAGVQKQIAAVDQLVGTLQGALTSLSASLEQNVQVAQSLGAAAIATINANAAAQLSALDNLNNSQLQIAAQTLAIQQAQAAERFAVIQEESANVLRAFEASAKARLDIAKRTSEDLVKVEQDIGIARRAVLQSIVDANRAHVNELIGQHTGYLNKVKEIEQQRIAFNQSVEDKILGIRIGGLSGYEQYQAKVGQIDKAISDARQALAKGDVTAAEAFAKKAIELSGGIATEVKEGERVVIDAYTAQQRAISKIGEAASIVTKALAAQEGAAKTGAEATKTALLTAQQELTKLSTKLGEISTKLAEGIQLSITANTDAVDAKIIELEANLAKRELLMKINASIVDAQTEIGKLRKDLEQGITINVDGRTDKIKAALKAVQDLHPEITVEVTKALADVGLVKSKADEIKDVRMKITPDAKEALEVIENLKKPTSSTHTVNIVTKGSVPGSSGAAAPGLASGGLVGSIRQSFAPARAAIQRFAHGGPVFKRPTWDKVPGTGNQDSVAAALPSGSFVVQKSASQYYGDGLMGLLAKGIRFFAGGGSASHDAPVIDKEKGFRHGDSFQGGLPEPQTFDVRQVPPVLINAAFVLEYARAMLNLVGPTNPLLGSLGPRITQGITKVENDPSNQKAINDLLQAAETIGSNPRIFAMIGKSERAFAVGKENWFYDFLQQNHAGELAAALKTSGGGSAGSGGGIAAGKVDTAALMTAFTKRFFDPSQGKKAFLSRIAGRAEGGPTGTDTVRAYLTPGEYVMPAPVVKKLGVPFFDFLNARHLRPQHLRDFLENVGRPPAPMRFAAGGLVGNLAVGAPKSFQGSGDGGKVEIHVHTSEKISEQSIRRMVLPVLNEIERKSKR